MKRFAILGIAVLFAGCLVVALGWIGFMTFLQSRVATMRVTVAGSVDAVTIYSVSDPTTVVASVRSNGEETTTEIKLPAARKGFTLVQPLPEKYFFRFHYRRSALPRPENLLHSQRLPGVSHPNGA